MSKQPFNEIDTECLDYIVNELRNNKSMQQMLNYYKGKYYSERYWELIEKLENVINHINIKIAKALNEDYDIHIQDLEEIRKEILGDIND